MRSGFRIQSLDSKSLRRLLAVALVASTVTVAPQVIAGKLFFSAQANVVVPESSTATSLYVSPFEFLALTSTDSNSVVMDFSAAIGQPEDWNQQTQRIAVEIAITAGGLDNSTVFRGTGNCMVDLSSNSSANTFGAAFANGAIRPTGVDADIFGLNDRTPQLTLNGEIDDVLTALQRVQISCDNNANLRNKYIRIGAVPTEDAATCGGANADTRCEPLYYLFSTQRYYRAACSNINAATNVCNISGGSGGNSSATTQGIVNLRDRAELLTIGVNGTDRTGGNRRGWVATLTTRDEILLTNALGLLNMIGTTDMDQDWTWNSNWGGTAGSTCTTSEGTFFWLGPDNWCQRVPTQNFRSDNREYIGGTSTPSGTLNGTATRYWRLNGTIWEVTTEAGLPTNGGIDMRSSTAPTTDNWTGTTNGKGFAHFWAATTNSVAEPNSSGDYVNGGYNAGDGIPGWDDSSPGSSNDAGGAVQARVTNFYTEFCSPAQPCAPPDAAVASTEILPRQLLDLRKATSARVDAQLNWLNLPQLSIGETTTANLVLCMSESSTSTAALRFSILNMGVTDASSVFSNETVTASNDSVFESSADAGQTLIFEGPRVAALAVFNSSSQVSNPLRVWRPSGTYFQGTEGILIRVVARSEIGRTRSLALCRQATSANSWVVTVTPYLLEKTVNKGDVELRRPNQ